MTVHFSKEQIEAMRNGTPLSGVVDQATGVLTDPQVIRAQSNVSISGYDTNVRPKIRNQDGSDAGSKKVSSASGKQLAAFNRLDEQKKIDEAKAAELARQEREELAPESLHSQVQYLTRAVKKLTKELNQLKVNTHDS